MKKESFSVVNIILGLSLLALLLYGCLAEGVSKTESDGDFKVELWSSAKCFQRGETVRLRATVTNAGSQAHILEIKDRPVFDIIVSYENAAVIARRWSADKALTSDLTRLELKPGQSKTIDWQLIMGQGIDPGAYVRAILISHPERPDVPLSPGLIVTSLCPGPFGP